jgi:ribosomal protein S18 acetylase RimI-like enzyme
MEQFLSGGYEAVLLEQENKVVAYGLYRDHPDHDDTIYLRQIFVVRDKRRQGIGRQVMNIFFNDIWPKDKHLTVEALSHNEIVRKFYQSVGFREYCLELEMKAQDRS